MRRRTLAAGLTAVLAPRALANSIDPTNGAQLLSVTQQALKNLLTYYTPSDLGVFNEVQTPWHASGMIWGMFMDYQTWTGDNQFASLVTGALVNLSYGTWQDILGGPLTTTNEKVLGKWNDDILWPAIAIAAGGKIYGGNTTMPGAKGPWITVPQLTLEETWQYEDSKCGGGIYWSRNPASSGGVYKSTITNVEFIENAARTNLLNGNGTDISQAQQLWSWLYSAGLIGSDGKVYDGFNVPNCTTLVDSDFTYNYGMSFGAAVWMNYVTKNSTWLSLASTIFYKSMGIFYLNGTVNELCEETKDCGRDAQDFKAVYLTHLAYLYRQTGDSNVRSSIVQMIDSSLNAMATRACDSNWNCNGNWTVGSQPVSYIRSQHVACALLVAALGVHTNATGSGLVPGVNGGTLNQTGDSTAGQTTTNQGSIDSWPLDAAPSVRAALPLVVAAAVLGIGVSVLV